ncbi:hypothetical protein BCT45_05160 [Vibrio breoganii]|nr:hypothetical protein BCT45_05160 [Vibrio breoganii]
MKLHGSTQVNKKDLLVHQRILATALVHECPIALHDLEKVEMGFFTDTNYKRVVSTCKSLYTEPHKQPNNKQIADEIHQELLNLGYAKDEADNVADNIENLAGYKRQPDAVSIANALNKLSLDIVRPYSLFDFKSGSEGFDTEFSYLVKGYVPAKSFGMIYGASGSFKSFHALSWACHIALGKEWNKCRVTQQPVLYIAGEGGIGVPRRIRALELRYNQGKPIEHLYRLDFPIAMGDVVQVNQLAHTIEHYSQEIGVQFGLVIIDTLARCFGSGDENKTEDMGRFVAACDRIKAQANVTVMVVHHSGVADKGRARGSSALRAACDFEFRIERAEQDSPALILSHTKSKDEQEQKRQQFELESCFLFIDSDGETVKSLVASSVGAEPVNNQDERPEALLSDHEQALYQIVRTRNLNQEASTINVVRDDLKAQGLNTTNFSRWLKGTKSKGVIAEIDGKLRTVSLRGSSTSITSSSSSPHSVRETSDEEQKVTDLAVEV